jgi:hypothetical protein
MLTMIAPVTEFTPGHMGAIQSTVDVRSWATYFAPDDDVLGAILAMLDAAISVPGVVTLSSQYGFTLPEVATRFAVLGKQPDSRFLFDKTQEAGRAERPVVQTLVKQLQPAQWAIGTSSKAGQILHEKGIVHLYPDGRGITLTGSFNLSTSASKQFNVIDIVESRSRAELFASRIQAMFDWVKKNEPGNLAVEAPA